MRTGTTLLYRTGIAAFSWALALSLSYPAWGEPPASSSRDEVPWDDLWEISKNKPFDFVFLCYLEVAEGMTQDVKTRLAGPDSEIRFIRFGGHNKIAEMAIESCNEDIRPQKRFSDETAYDDARKVMKLTAAQLDEKFLQTCQSEPCKKFAEEVLKP